MLIFLKALKQFFLCLFSSNEKTSKIVETKIDNKSTNMALHISLLNNADINIELVKPSLENIDSQIIIDLAEQYASFLLYTHTKLFKEQLINNIKTEYKNSSNFYDKLFYDNVLAFYSILENEIDRLSSHSRPLIRPTSVFNTQNH